MGDIVDLRGHPLGDDISDELVADLARFSEGLLSEKFIKMKHHLAESVWAALGDDDKFIERVELEKICRLHSGASKREKAQQLVVQAPEVAGTIMLDSKASPKHRLDAAKVLDGFATGGPGESAAAEARFSIVINLGSDSNGVEHIERYSKSIEINPNDEPDDTDDPTPVGGILAAFIKKPTGGNDGNPL